MFASTLFADEDDVLDFNFQIQKLLRQGRADEAATIFEAALGELGDDSHPAVALCRSCAVEDVAIAGWDLLAERIAALDAAGTPITALGIDISWPGHSGAQPDAEGHLEPVLETNFYGDTAYPFAASDRGTLLQGYGPHGAAWQGRMAGIETLLTTQGLGKAYGAVFPLVEQISATPEPEPREADAVRLCAAFLAVRLHQAVDRAIRTNRLPRPLAVIVGSNESYPFYDAPVMSLAESAEFADEVPAIEQPEPVAKDEVAMFDAAQVEAEQVEARQAEAEPADAETAEAGPAEVEQDRKKTDALVLDADQLVIQLSGASLRQRIGQQPPVDRRTAPRRSASGMIRRLFVRKVAAG